MGINFPSSPTLNQQWPNPATPGVPVWYWDGEKWTSGPPGLADGLVHYDVAQNLTATNKATARDNIGVQKKNYILNGGMQVSQENGQNLVAVPGSGVYVADMFVSFNGTSGAATAQNVSVSTPGGSTLRNRYTVTVADTTIINTEWAVIQHKIEGVNVLDLGFGTVNAKTFTLRFGVKAPAGTYCISVSNGAQDRGYVAEYTISAGEANTDVVRTITIPGDTTGTWDKAFNTGLLINFVFASGSSFFRTPNVWGGTNAFASANQYNLFSVAGNVFELFDVGLYEGTIAPPFALPKYTEELEACRRYWQALVVPILGGYMQASVTNYYLVTFMKPMRTTPTAGIITAPAQQNCSYSLGAGQITYMDIRMDVTATGTGAAYIQNGLFSLNARL